MPTTVSNLATQVSGILAATHLPADTGDEIRPQGSAGTTVVGINGVNLAGLGAGIYKYSAIGVPSIATPGVDWPGLGSTNTYYSPQRFQVPWGATPGSSVALATSGTISLAAAAALVAPTSAITGVIIPVGAFPGQVINVINNSAFTITFAAVATSHVADGVSDVIPALTSREFIYSGTSWFRKA